MLHILHSLDAQGIQMDHFSRNVADAHNYSADLKDNGVELVSVMERLDDSPSGELIKHIITDINAFYVRNLATETMRESPQGVSHHWEMIL